MASRRIPTTYLTAEELKQIAAVRFKDATALDLKTQLPRELPSSNLEYRAYVIDEAGHHLPRFVSLDCTTDDMAIERAIDALNGHDIELWKGDRIIARMLHHLRH